MQLQQLKKELEKCRQDLHRYTNLLNKREIELEKIHDLKDKVEAKLVRMHQLMKTDVEKANAIKQNIKDATEQISLLRQTVKQIDEELDQLGDEKNSTFEMLKHSLISQIQQNIPQSSEEYQRIAQGLNTAQTEETFYTEQINLTVPLFNLLKEGDATIKRKGGVLNFLFSAHPRATLARLVHEASDLANKIYPELQEESIKNFLQKFLAGAKKMDQKKLTYLFQELSLLMTTLEEKRTHTQQTILAHETAIERWIEKYCSMDMS